MNKKTIVGVVKDLESKKNSMESEIEKISEMIDVLKDTKEYSDTFNNCVTSNTKEVSDFDKNCVDVINTFEKMLDKNTKKYSKKNVIL